MIKPAHLIAVALAAVVLIPSPALAGGKKGKKGSAGASRVLGRFDRNHDGSLDSTEAERAKSIYAALAGADSDHDGKLSDTEIAAVKLAPAGKKAAKKKTGPSN